MATATPARSGPPFRLTLRGTAILVSLLGILLVYATDQILLVSTAHRRATVLMVGRRARALDHLADGDGPLLLEWSAPPDAELDDRDGWRQASPHWTRKRERLVGQRLEGALAGESDDVDEPDAIASFRTQWLNQWPAKQPSRSVADAPGDETPGCSGATPAYSGTDEAERQPAPSTQPDGAASAAAGHAMFERLVENPGHRHWTRSA